MEVDEFLSHHGIKGMKWGRRKNRTAKEEKIRSKRARISNRRRQLSDSDIKTFIERLSNEKKLKSLVDEDLKPGRTVAKRIMSDSGQKVARTVVSGAGIILVKHLVEKKMSPGTKVKLNAQEVADTLARGSLKKK